MRDKNLDEIEAAQIKLQSQSVLESEKHESRKEST